MANPYYSNAGHFYAPQVTPALLNCSFEVNADSSNAKGTQNLTGPGIRDVFMHVDTAAATPTATILAGDTVITPSSLSGIFVGQTVTDTTTPGVIDSDTKIVSIDSGGGTFTIDKPALTNSGVADSLSAVFILAAGQPNPEAGVIVVQLAGNHNLFLGEWNCLLSPETGSPILLSAASLTPGVPYIVYDKGTSPDADFYAAGFPAGYQVQVGASFIASAAGSSAGTGSVIAVGSSGIASIEVVGDPSLMIAGMLPSGPTGSQLILQCLDFAGSLAAPAQFSVIKLNIYLSDSSVKVAGQ